jgi:cytohesin/brefeldin A-inhibited guanine nucleotide-exchange protein
MDEEVVEVGEILITMRPDLPPVKDLLMLTRVFMGVFQKDQLVQGVCGLANFLHSFHFLSFYRGDKNEIELRIQLFEHLMEVNTPTVKSHFKGLRLETRMFLVGWFLTLFGNCFEGEFLLRIWDNFVLEGELYLFRVGIALIKYYEVELKMCTFN